MIIDHKYIYDRLLLICDKFQEMEPLGTGFIINELGYFITARHVIERIYDRHDSLKDCIICKCKEMEYSVEYIDSLKESGFYKAQKKSKLACDLILLQLKIQNENLEIDHFPCITFDMNKKFIVPFEVLSGGFKCETPYTGRYPDFFSFEIINEYEEKNGLWEFKINDDNKLLQHGHSGSPVIHPELGEVIGVVLRRFDDDNTYGYIQSLHMLYNDLKRYDYNCETFFRSPCSLFSKYHEEKSISFEKENWPYAIDKKNFVDAFDFQTSRFPISDTWEFVKNEVCVPFIVKKLKEHPIYCVGYYGMGKTTISKFLFSNYRSLSNDEYPVFISLANITLSDITLTNWENFIADRMCEDFWKSVKNKRSEVLSVSLVKEYFTNFIKNYKVLLIFDGIDESIYEDSSLKRFSDVLNSLPCPYLLTSRKEFYAFFDVFNDRMRNQSHLVVELTPWSNKQWKLYIENLYHKYPSKSDKISDLDKALNGEEYGELPERPLFLKMISDIHLDNRTNLDQNIPKNLRKNRSALYHIYICWKIEDDFIRADKPRGFELESFKEECLKLFEELAFTEYTRSVPKRGAVEYLEQNNDHKELNIFSGFTLNEVKKACQEFDLLNPEFVRENLLGPTFFTIIRREKSKLFRFSHKSFCEYLFGFSLAQEIFKGTAQDAKCSKAWNYYQTHEVSAHFQDEIKRLSYLKNLSKNELNEYLQVAFEKVLGTLKDMRNYSELIEEVLYYTGKYKIQSSKILGILQKIAENPFHVHQIYYRTAHLSLSMCTDVEWCEKYIEYLLYNFKGNKDAFELNTNIQIKYYGKGNIHSVLKNNIDKFINGEEKVLVGIMPLKIFSYFVCFPFVHKELLQAKKYLSKIKDICIERGCLRMAKILDNTLPIMESISGGQ